MLEIVILDCPRCDFREIRIFDKESKQKFFRCSNCDILQMAREREQNPSSYDYNQLKDR